MPKPPLIASERVRNVVIMGVMGAVFLGSIGLAWVVTGAPLGRPAEPEPTRYRVGPASIALPGAWQPTQIQRQRIVFTNRASPEEQLIAYFGSVPRPEPAASVLVNRVLPMEGIRKSTQENLQPTTLEQGQFATASLVLITRKTPLTSTRIIQSIGVATRDGRGYWVFNLRLNPTQQAIQTYGENLPGEQLHRVQHIMQTLEPLPSE